MILHVLCDNETTVGEDDNNSACEKQFTSWVVLWLKLC